MEIQSITNVVSIHKSITSLTHLIDHSYCQAWSALLAAAILTLPPVTSQSKMAAASQDADSFQL